MSDDHCAWCGQRFWGPVAIIISEGARLRLHPNCQGRAVEVERALGRLSSWRGAADPRPEGQGHG